MAPALHSMAVLQVYQAKLLASEDESGPDPAMLRELRSMTDLELCATKTMAQAIGHSMASLMVLECQLWLTLTEIKDTDKVQFLNALSFHNSLCRPAVEGFTERFTDAQKSSQAMQHFLSMHSSTEAASRWPKSAPTQQPTKPATLPEEEGTKSKPPITPSSSGCSQQCVCCKLWAHSSTQMVIHCYSRQKKPQNFSKREQIFCSVSYE